MAKRNRTTRRVVAKGPVLPPEDRRSEALTVAWMLCALFAFCAEVGGLIVSILLASSPANESTEPAALLLVVASAISWVAGLLTLLLTPIVYRMRKTPPPAAIILMAMLIGLAPPVMLVIGWLSRLSASS